MASESIVNEVRDTKLVTLKENRIRSRSPWATAAHHILRDRLTIMALTALVVLTLGCLFAPPFFEQTLGVNSNRTDIVNNYNAPGTGNNVLGTDHLGRDQLVRLLYGGRVSLGVAYGASIMSISIGLIIGMIAGYYGGWIDDFVNWFITTLTSIPQLFLLILISVIFTPTAEVLVVLLGILGWVTTCRLVRSEIRALKEREFVIAARALGAPTWRMLAAHFLPNVASLVIISLTIDAGQLILTESALSFLGLGVRPPTPSWGNMLTEARKFFSTGPHLVVWPGLMIVITVLCFFIVGDGLRDALDPRTAKQK